MVKCLENCPGTYLWQCVLEFQFCCGLIVPEVNCTAAQGGDGAVRESNNDDKVVVTKFCDVNKITIYAFQEWVWHHS